MKYLLLTILFISCSSGKQDIVNRMQDLKKDIALVEADYSDLRRRASVEGDASGKAYVYNQKYDHTKYSKMKDSLFWLEVDIKKKKKILDSLDLELRGK